jgi:hypothetical protein
MSRNLILGRTILTAALIAMTLAVAATASARPNTTSTISPVQFAKRADTVCGRDARQQARLGDPLLNAEIVPQDHLWRAAEYLDKIVAITRTEIAGLRAIAPTHVGMHQRRAFVAAIVRILADERRAAAAAHRGDLTGFRAAFDRFIVRGRPTGPDYRVAEHAYVAASKLFPFKVCGHTSSVYP